MGIFFIIFVLLIRNLWAKARYCEHSRTQMVVARLLFIITVRI